MQEDSLFNHEGAQHSVPYNDKETNGKVDYTRRTYSVMLKLIAGSLVGTTDYIFIYDDMDDMELDGATENQIPGSPVPTLVDVARRVAKFEGKKLDDKQYIAYEIICCTFLLGLVTDGRDPDSALRAYLQQAIAPEDDERDMNKLTEELKVRGGHDQLLMFLTGPAGAGKSEAVKLARRFCFEFCLAIGTLWNDKRFFFTAYTGSAAMLVGG